MIYFWQRLTDNYFWISCGSYLNKYSWIQNTGKKCYNKNIEHFFRWWYYWRCWSSFTLGTSLFKFIWCMFTSNYTSDNSCYILCGFRWSILEKNDSIVSLKCFLEFLVQSLGHSSALFDPVQFPFNLNSNMRNYKNNVRFAWTSSEFISEILEPLWENGNLTKNWWVFPMKLILSLIEICYQVCSW